MVKSPMFREAMGEEAENVEKLIEDPDMLKQMTGFWRQLDEMAGSDKKGYDDFIKKQRKEYEAEQKKKQEEREKQRIITPTALCSLKCLPAKIIDKKKDLSDSIKLFDFDQNAEMNRNIVASSD